MLEADRGRKIVDSQVGEITTFDVRTLHSKTSHLDKISKYGLWERAVHVY